MRQEIIKLRLENDSLREQLTAAQGDIASLKDLIQRGASMREYYFTQVQELRAEVTALTFQLRSVKILQRGGCHEAQSG